MIGRFALVALAAGLVMGCQPANGSPETHQHMAKTAEVSALKVDARDLVNPWTVDKTESTITFEFKEQGQSYTGCFDDFDLQIDLDPDQPQSGAIYLTINMASAVGGTDERNSALPGKDWFNIKSFPTAEFISTDIIRDGKTSYVAKGNLLLKGVSKPVELPFSLSVNGDTAHAIGQTDLNRLDFNVGEGDFKTGDWIGLKVIVKVDITASR